MLKAATIAIAGIALTVGLAAASASAAPTPGAGDPAGGAGERAIVPGEIVVGLRGGGERVVEVPSAVSPGEAIASLERNAAIAYAGRNWIATAAVDPLDRGHTDEVGGWRQGQWNFLGAPGGVRVEPAWARAAAAGRGGGQGVKVAVIDTGVAYADAPGGFAISPDFSPAQFEAGRDFVDGDREPLDENGHGTHIAGTIAEQVTLEPVRERDYLTGLAYGASVIPVRVLDRRGTGTSVDVARGIRWAVRRDADVINLSLGLPAKVRRCKQIRGVCRAIRWARRQGALVVAAAGNRLGGGRSRVTFPAAAPGVLAVGASTEGGCLAGYSDHGRRLDLLAPGGGRASTAAAPRCRRDSAAVRQLTLSCFVRAPRCSTFDRFAIRPGRGTSMAAAHASGVAALVRASGALGAGPTPGRVRRHLKCSARSVGRPRFHGSGLLDAARATRPRAPRRCRR